jgi:hypothetical protein
MAAPVQCENRSPLGGQHHFIFLPSSNRQSAIANRKSTGGFKGLQRIGNDAAANDNLIGCAHKISGWPLKSTMLLTDPNGA